MFTKILFIVVIAASVLLGFRMFDARRAGSTLSFLPNVTSQEKTVFGPAQKSVGWISNTPAHGATFAAVPVHVVIDFTLELTASPTISIMKDGKEFGVGAVAIDSNRRSMRRRVDTSAPDGIYTVSYRSCWSDGNCGEGKFQFAIKRSLAEGFEDHTGTPDVTVLIVDNSFMPKEVRISKNTRITWKNMDMVDHFVNTDPYPSNTYYPKLNSYTITPEGAFPFVFPQPGIYPYHDDSAAQTMTGSIIVE